MFKSVPRFEGFARRILQGYTDLVEKSERDLLQPDSTTTAGDIYNLKHGVESYRRNSQIIRDAPEWSMLPEDLRDDITALIEEADLLAAEVAEDFAPDAAWADLDKPTQKSIAIGLPVSSAKVAKFADRISHRTRKAKHAAAEAPSTDVAEEADAS